MTQLYRNQLKELKELYLELDVLTAQARMLITMPYLNLNDKLEQDYIDNVDEVVRINLVLLLDRLKEMIGKVKC
jgi:hypothetical protein